MQKILKKLHKIMTEIGYIQKDARNPHHGYTYASERAIKTAVQKALVNNGVLFKLEIMSSKPIELPQLITKRGTETPSATVLECGYAFYDVESGESFGGHFVSSGPARDDKGHWAAVTNAIKYILTSTFLIPTGDDAESEVNHPANGSGEREAAPAKSKTKAKAEAAKPTLKAKFWAALKQRAADMRLDLPAASDELVQVIAAMGACEVAGTLCLEHEHDFPIMPTADPDSPVWAAMLAVCESYDLGKHLPPAKKGDAA